MGIKHVHTTVKSLNGCDVEIDGDVEYTMLPPRMVGFHGAVRISGGPGCPNGDLYFGIEPKGKAALTLPASGNKP
jgi:hypothetical protein